MLRPLLASLAALALLGSGLPGCGAAPDAPTGRDEDGSAETGAVASVVVVPSSAQLFALGASRRLEAMARTEAGDTLDRAEFAWSSSPAGVVDVDSTGRVTARADGAAEVTAVVDSVEGHATVIVRQRTDSVAVSPASARLAAGDTLRFSAEARDANGHPVPGADVRWRSLDTLVATVDPTGRAVARDTGETGIVAAAGTAADTAALAVGGGTP